MLRESFWRNARRCGGRRRRRFLAETGGLDGDDCALVVTGGGSEWWNGRRCQFISPVGESGGESEGGCAASLITYYGAVDGDRIAGQLVR